MLPSPAPVRRPTLVFGLSLIFILIAGMGTAFWTQDARRWPAATSWRDGQALRTLERHFERHLLVRDPAVQSWNALRFALFGEAHPAVVVGDDGWLFLAEEFRTERQAEQQTEINLRRTAQVDARLRSAGATLVVVLIPAKAATYKDRLARSVLPAAVNARYSASRQALEERGMAVVDLPPVFQAARPTGEVFLRTDLHWTPLGAGRAAQATAQVVRQSFPALSLPVTRFKTVLTPPQAFTGGLLRYLDFGRWQARLGPQPELLTRASTVPVATSSNGLLGEPPVPVALVGTSFSADVRWNFAGFLREALSAQVLNAAQDGLSPFEAMNRYLNSPEFLAQPPQVVVWEIPERYLSTASTVRGVE